VLFVRELLHDLLGTFLPKQENILSDSSRPLSESGCPVTGSGPIRAFEKITVKVETLGFGGFRQPLTVLERWHGFRGLRICPEHILRLINGVFLATHRKD
jgi:hypothetical protein